LEKLLFLSRRKNNVQKKLATTFIVILLLISVFSLSGFQQIKGENPNSRLIKIGLVEPLSTNVGIEMDNAADLAVEEINNAGGIYVSEWGEKVNITIDIVNTIDDSPLNSVLPVTQAVTSDQVDLLIGGYAGSGTLADEVVAIQNRVPFIITGASNQLVTRRGPQGNYGGLPLGDSLRIEDAEGMSYIFHYGSTTYQTSKSVVHFIAEYMKPTVAPDRHIRLAFIYREDAFGNGVEQASKFWIQNDLLPIDIVAERATAISSTNFQTDLTVIKGANPDVIFVVNNPDITPLLIKQGLNEVGINVPFIASDNNEDIVFYTLLGNYGDTQFLNSEFAPFVGSPCYSRAVANFVYNYEQKYHNLTPRRYGANVYDAFYIVKDAIERAGTIDKAAVRQAIEETNLPQMLTMTETGKIQFSTTLNYHEIAPVSFVEKLFWNIATSELKPLIVWPKVPVSVFLEVPYQNQGYAEWCVPTSLAMVLRYYGLEFHGWDYASDAKLSTGSGPNTIDFWYLSQYVHEKDSSLTVEYGNYYNPINKDQIFTDIQSNLIQGYPVMLAIGGLPNFSLEGHFVVVVGFNSTGLFINDPSGALFTIYLRNIIQSASYTSAYVPWSLIQPYIVTWPFSSTITIKGVPNPDSKYGTMSIDISSNDIAFYQTNYLSNEKSSTQLRLNQGLEWCFMSKDSAIPDNVVDTACSYLLCRLYISNSKYTPESFTVNWKIVGPQGIIYPLKTIEIGQIQALSQRLFDWSIEDLKSLPLGGPYRIDFSLLNSNDLVVDHFVTPPFYRGGQTITLVEIQHHLYLHVYDGSGNHVGFNYITNQTELGISNSYYIDDGNGTITVALPSADNVKVVVDAKYAEEPIETYNVTVTSKTVNGVSVQGYFNTIAAGQTKTVIDILPTPTDPQTPSPSPTQNPTPMTTPTPTPTPTLTPTPTPTNAPITQTTIATTNPPTNSPTKTPTMEPQATSTPTIKPTPSIPEITPLTLIVVFAVVCTGLAVAKRIKQK
jgi:branched-chain amino acid transport system substrate-binding protein